MIIGPIEMTADSILYHDAQVIPILALGEDGVAERTRPEAAFLRFLHLKNNLGHHLAL